MRGKRRGTRKQRPITTLVGLRGNDLQLSTNTSRVSAPTPLKCTDIHTSTIQPYTAVVGETDYITILDPTGRRIGVNISKLQHIQPVKWDLPTVINTNIHWGLTGKLDEIKELGNASGAEIIAITETWCKIVSRMVPSLLLALTHAGDTDKMADNAEASSAICSLIHPKKHWKEHNDPTLESICLTLRPRKIPKEFPQLTVGVGVIYHPPNANDLAMVKHINHSLDRTQQQHPHTGMMPLGDFNNLKDVTLKRNHSLRQIVKKPTRDKSMLDKIFTNMETVYGEPEILAPIGLSDHNIVVCYPALSSNYVAPTVNRVATGSQRHSDRALFINALQEICWEPMYSSNTCTEKFSFERTASKLCLRPTYQSGRSKGVPATDRGLRIASEILWSLVRELLQVAAGLYTKGTRTE